MAWACSFPLRRAATVSICSGVTAGELAGLTAEELRIARNEIYARHGRWFKSEDLNRYFRKKSWYEPSVEPDAFDSSVFSATESQNIQYLLEKMEALQ